MAKGEFTHKKEAKKQLREHQQKALSLVKEAFKTEERGKLIMACGTGKTFTSLKITKKHVNTLVFNQNTAINQLTSPFLFFALKRLYASQFL